MTLLDILQLDRPIWRVEAGRGRDVRVRRLLETICKLLASARNAKLFPINQIASLHQIMVRAGGGLCSGNSSAVKISPNDDADTVCAEEEQQQQTKRVSRQRAPTPYRAKFEGRRNI